jgi:hypothetical protein
MDAYAGALTDECWEWQSTAIDASEVQKVIPEMMDIDIERLRTVVDCTDKRTNVMIEILETEQNYANQLLIAQSLYRKGLRELGIVPEKSLDLIFAGMGIWTLH